MGPAAEPMKSCEPSTSSRAIGQWRSWSRQPRRPLPTGPVGVHPPLVGRAGHAAPLSPLGVLGGKTARASRQDRRGGLAADPPAVPLVVRRFPPDSISNQTVPITERGVL